MTPQPVPAGAVVDVHAHCVPERALAELDRDAVRYGFEVGEGGARQGLAVAGKDPLGRIRPDLVDLPGRLAAMDAMGVDVQVLSPWIDLTAYGLAAEPGTRYARMLNEQLAELAGAHPTRFRAVGTVPLQSPAAAAAELRHAVTELGMVGVEIATTVAGRDLDDPDLEPFWSAAAELRCLVLLHPCASLAGRGVSRYFLGNLVGNPAESTVAVGHLVFGGVLERHPGLQICVVHGGGFAPYQLGRWDHGYDRNARGAAVNLTRRPSEWVRQMYFDTVLHSPERIRTLVDVVGVSRVVLGSDYPFEMGDHTPIQTVDAVPGLRAEEREAIVSGNLVQLVNQVHARTAG